MGKKTGKKTKKGKVLLEEKKLPQNICLIGEHVEDDKNIYISQTVYREIHKFAGNKTTNESGGLLIGTVIEEFGKTNIIVQGFVEAKYVEATPTTLTFTHETWDYCHKTINDRYENAKILGWIHTHPNFGIFLSEYDKFIQENFFKDENQVAYVVDPIQQTEGFYYWAHEKIERCKGFYIFDKTGAEINIENAEEKVEDEIVPEKPAQGNLISYAVNGCLFIAVIILLISYVNLKNRLETLETQQENLLVSVDIAYSSMQNQILFLQQRMEEVQTVLVDENSEEIPDDDTEETTEQ
ncbi:MAG: hypothetical protein K2N01_07535 [Lachnospiraceae bacterium]|nr:hypothetical protein [Lachnospiraceae bacterium]